MRRRRCECGLQDLRKGAILLLQRLRFFPGGLSFPADACRENRNDCAEVEGSPVTVRRSLQTRRTMNKPTPPLQHNRREEPASGCLNTGDGKWCRENLRKVFYSTGTFPDRKRLMKSAGFGAMQGHRPSGDQGIRRSDCTASRAPFVCAGYAWPFVNNDCPVYSTNEQLPASAEDAEQP